GLVVGTGDLSELALGWCTYGVGDHMSHYNVNASVAKTLIQHLIRFVASSGDVDETTARVLHAILETGIWAELVPASAGALQSTEQVIGPYALQDFNLYYVTRYGFRPSKIAFLAYRAWGDIERGAWPPNIPAAKRRAYTLAEIKHWLEVFLFRFFSLSQFKPSALPNGPKIPSARSPGAATAARPPTARPTCGSRRSRRTCRRSSSGSPVDRMQRCELRGCPASRSGRRAYRRCSTRIAHAVAVLYDSAQPISILWSSHPQEPADARFRDPGPQSQLPARSGHPFPARYRFLQIPDASIHLDALCGRARHFQPDQSNEERAARRAHSRGAAARPARSSAGSAFPGERADLARRQPVLRQAGHFPPGIHRIFAQLPIAGL